MKRKAKNGKKQNESSINNKAIKKAIKNLPMQRIK